MCWKRNCCILCNNTFLKEEDCFHHTHKTDDFIANINYAEFFLPWKYIKMSNNKIKCDLCKLNIINVYITRMSSIYFNDTSNHMFYWCTNAEQVSFRKQNVYFVQTQTNFSLFSTKGSYFIQIQFSLRWKAIKIEPAIFGILDLHASPALFASSIRNSIKMPKKR